MAEWVYPPASHQESLVSLIRLPLLIIVCVSGLLSATVPDHPLYFEERASQLFETRAAGQSVTIRADRIELDGVTLRFVRPSRNARLQGVGTPAPSTYITRGQTRGFRAYPKAGIRQLYPGTDVMFYGSPRQLEYDLDLARGAKPDRIRIDVSGALRIRLDEQGNLIIDTRSGELRQLAPKVFQTNHGVRRAVPANYVLLSTNEIGFRLGKHDRTIPLTIDPVIVYTKYFGGSGSDLGGPVATDAQGNVYVTGSTNSIDFPSTNGTRSRLQPPLLAYSNAGQTVTPLPVDTQTSVNAIGGTPDGTVLYVATTEGIYFSANSGSSFAPTAPVPVSSTGIYPPVISVDAIDPSRVYVATTSGLFSTGSHGESWGENDLGMAVGGNGMVNAESVEVSAVDHTVLYATTLTPNYLYTSTDAGATWQQLYPSYPGEPAPGQFSGSYITFTFAPGGSDLYVIDGNGVFFMSPDGGLTWQKLSGDYLFGAKSITIDPNNPSNIYVVDGAGLQQSTNAGATFNTISPMLPAGDNIQSFAMDGTGALYFATGSQIEVSVDQGATWKVLPSRPNPHVLVGLGGKVYAGVDSPSIPFVVKWSPDGSQMLYSTFFGSSDGDSITAIAIDAQGEAIIAGNTSSPDFPVTETISPVVAGTGSGFVAKLSADGSQAIYSSIIGASQSVNIGALAIDSTGAPYITGYTSAANFPTTPNALQPNLPTAMCQRPSGNLFMPGANLGTFGFVSKLSASASSLVFSTFLTGACGSQGQGIAVDSTGEPVVVGLTTSPDFPVSTNAYQSTFPGGPTATITYPNPINFGFVTKLSAAGDKLVASSFIGGGYTTVANALALDSSGDAYITGSTTGITPGATAGAYQTTVNQSCTVSGFGPAPPSIPANAFLLKLDPAFTTAQYLTYLGTGCFTSGYNIVLGLSGNVWIAGSPAPGFPLVAPYELPNTGSYFVSEFNADASQLLFSSYSDGQYLAQDPAGAIYVSGSGTAIAGPPKNQPYPSSVSLTKIDPTGTPAVVIDSIGVSASYQTVASPQNTYATSVAPGELIGIVGQNLGPSATMMAQLDSTGHLPYVVNATSVSFNGYLAPIISVQAGLIVCFAPFEITGPTDVTVTVDGQSSTPVRVAVIPVAPYILSIVNQDGSMNSASHPAPQGSVVTIYVTGLGLTSPLSQDGSVSAPPLPVPVTQVSGYIDINPVTPLFVGAAEGLVAGITQVNVQIPTATYSSNAVSASVDSAMAQIYIVQ
jgi:uncharacterized protein (TIGR03437 family)